MRRDGIGQGALLLDNAQAALDEILAGLGRQRFYACTATGTAAAANAGIVEVKNPAASGKVLYFFMGDLWVATAMKVTVVFDGTTTNPAGVPSPMYDGGGASVATFGGTNQNAPTGAAWITSPSLAINTPYLLPAWFWAALPAGKNLQLQGGTVNQAFTANLRWVELTT